MSGFLKLMRDSEELETLIKDGYHKEFVLLTFMAIRARRTYCPITKLDIGECRLGDYREYGLTERGYRTAKSNLEKWGLATFSASRKGTVGKISNSMIYDINAMLTDEQIDEQIDEQATNRRRTGDEQATSNKNDKKEKNVKKVFIPPTPEEVRNYCLERNNGINPDHFFNHYETNNWFRGKTKIRDWKACVRTWESKNKQQNPQQQNYIPKPFPKD